MDENPDNIAVQVVQYQRDIHNIVRELLEMADEQVDDWEDEELDKMEIPEEEMEADEVYSQSKKEMDMFEAEAHRQLTDEEIEEIKRRDAAEMDKDE
jgi:hypothetical protein